MGTSRWRLQIDPWAAPAFSFFQPRPQGQSRVSASLPAREEPGLAPRSPRPGLPSQPGHSEHMWP